MREENQHIAFCTPDIPESQWPECFGCASFGFATDTWYETYSSSLAAFPMEIKGVRIEGAYNDIVLQAAKASQNKDVKAAMVLTANAGNENAFITALSMALPKTPLFGGGAAADIKTNTFGKVFPGAVQASVLLITDPHIEVEHTYENIHNYIEGEYTSITENPRLLAGVKNDAGIMDGIKHLDEKRRQIGLAEKNYELITFSNTDGINIHLSEAGGKLKSGADIAEKLILRWVDPKDVQDKMERFYQGDNAIIFGCAGLKGLLSKPVIAGANSIGLFMFGEIMTASGKPHFGNLMLSKVKFQKK